MTFSMTGFARVETSGRWGRMSWELRSVNHRYLDLQFRLPDEFRVLEPELRQQLAGAVARGKVECSLKQVSEAVTDTAPLQLDEARLAAIRDALERVRAACPGTAAMDPLAVLQFPGVLKPPPNHADDRLKEARAGFTELLAVFNQARASEGGRLRDYLLVRATTIVETAAQVRQRCPDVRTAWLERMRQRALELKVELDPVRVEQELVLTLQRLDVDEELSRLASHVDEVRKALTGREPVGRRLDFLMQELNREANTLSSKSQDAEMTRLAVDMKVMIEQMREQVQNLE